MGDTPTNTSRNAEVLRALQALINAQTWVASREVMRTQERDLFAPEADPLFARILERNAADSDLVEFLTRRRDLLAHARQVGIDAAYADLITPEYLQSLVEELRTLPYNNPRRIDVARALLKVNEAREPWVQARLEFEVAQAIVFVCTDTQQSDLPEAIDLLQHAATLLTREHDPHEYPRVFYVLSLAFLKRSDGDRETNLRQVIQYGQAAVAALQDDPQHGLLGAVWSNIGDAWRLLAANKPGASLDHAIACYRQGLTDLARDDNPRLWATLHLSLADSLFITGSDPGLLSDDVLEHYTRSLEVWTEQEPELAHRIEARVARAYFHRYQQTPDSRRRPDAEHAIEHFEGAFAGVPDTDDPSLDLAQDHQALAQLYELRKAGDHADNLQRSLVHYTAALHGYEHLGVPIGIAMCHYWIGCVLLKQQGAPNPPQIRAAIEQFHIALESYPTAESPELRADVAMEMGDALADLSAGDRGENLQAAIGYYREALHGLGPQEPGRWIRVNSALGVALLECSGGDRAQNLEEAIQHQRAVLASVTRESDPREWALAHHNLGNCYNERTLGDRAQNIEDAIEHFEAAASVFSRDEHPDEWAMVHNSLGGAYQHRARGERSQNLETAIQHFNQALQVYTRDAFPFDYAMALHNLANAYLQRVEGYEPDNIERGIRAHEASLEFRTREAVPFYWAMTQINLGNAYLQREYGSHADNTREAVRHFRLALEVHTREASPTNWAWAQFSLGSITHCADPDLDQRIQHLEGALEIYDRDSYPERWAQTHNNLALAYRERTRAGSDSSALTIQHLQAALQVFTPEDFPGLCRDTHGNLADEYLIAHDWEAALHGYTLAMEAGQHVLAAAYTEQGRLSESSHSNKLFIHSAYCLLRLGRAQQSFLRLEAGRMRHLAESLAQSNADLQRLPAELRERLRQARADVRAIEAEMRIPDEDLPSVSQTAPGSLGEMFPEAQQTQVQGARIYSLSLHQLRTAFSAFGLSVGLGDRLREARQRLQALIRAALATDPDFIRTEIGAAEVLSLIPAGGALVAFMLTSVGSAAWVIPAGAPQIELTHALTLDDLTHQAVEQLLVGRHGGAGWLGSYFDSRESGELTPWLDTIDSATQTLWTVLMGPIQSRLEELGQSQATPVLLVPQSRLGLLPLHAAWREVDDASTNSTRTATEPGIPADTTRTAAVPSAPSGPHGTPTGHDSPRPRRTFLDDHPVTYTPSLYALSVSQRRLSEPPRQPKRLLAVINPTGDLPYALTEGRAVAHHFNTTSTDIPTSQRPTPQAEVLTAQQATQTAVLTKIPGSTYLHFATHGVYDWRDVMRSHLLLAGPSQLRLSQVLSDEVDLSAARLVVLSACETGVTEFQRAPEEFLGLPAGFIEGGAPGVISALWSVNDVSTALLFEEFYRRHLEAGEGVASALRAAQLWVRSSTAEQLRLAERWSEVYKTPGTPTAYAYKMMRYYRANPQSIPYAAPYYWAAFTFSGA